MKNPLANFTGRAWYYNLTTEEKTVYDELFHGLLNLQFEIKGPDLLSVSSLDRALTALFYDNPTIGCYTKFDSMVATRTGDGTALYRFEPLYQGPMLERHLAGIKGRLDKIVEKKQLLGIDSPRETLEWIYAQATLATCYREAGENSHTANGALYGAAVCEGISLYFELVCQALEIPCRVVVGHLRKRENDDPTAANHAWNLVYVAGTQLYVDVTHDLRQSSLERPSGKHLAPPDAAVWKDRKVIMGYHRFFGGGNAH